MIFVTHNRHKFEEINEMFRKSHLDLEWKNMEYEEIQADTTEEISRKSCELLSKTVGDDFFLEDTGLYISALNGFPGPYSSYVVQKIGLNGILKLLEGKERSAYFLTVISLFKDGKVMQFHGRSNGRISTNERGSNGFGYDPVFIPEESELTLSEMDLSGKNAVSHRARAVIKLIDYLQGL